MYEFVAPLLRGTLTTALVLLPAVPLFAAAVVALLRFRGRPSAGVETLGAAASAMVALGYGLALAERSAPERLLLQATPFALSVGTLQLGGVATFDSTAAWAALAATLAALTIPPRRAGPPVLLALAGVLTVVVADDVGLAAMGLVLGGFAWDRRHRGRLRGAAPWALASLAFVAGVLASGGPAGRFVAVLDAADGSLTGAGVAEPAADHAFVTLDAVAGATLLLDDQRVPLEAAPGVVATSPFRRVALASGFHTVRVHAAGGEDEAVLPRVRFAPGATVTLLPTSGSLRAAGVGHHLRDGEGRPPPSPLLPGAPWMVVVAAGVLLCASAMAVRPGLAGAPEALTLLAVLVVVQRLLAAAAPAPALRAGGALLAGVLAVAVALQAPRRGRPLSGLHLGFALAAQGLALGSDVAPMLLFASCAGASAALPRSRAAAGLVGAAASVAFALQAMAPGAPAGAARSLFLWAAGLVPCLAFVVGVGLAAGPAAPARGARWAPPALGWAFFSAFGVHASASASGVDGPWLAPPFAAILGSVGVAAAWLGARAGRRRAAAAFADAHDQGRGARGVRPWRAVGRFVREAVRDAETLLARVAGVRGAAYGAALVVVAAALALPLGRAVRPSPAPPFVTLGASGAPRVDLVAGDAADEGTLRIVAGDAPLRVLRAQAAPGHEPLTVTPVGAPFPRDLAPHEELAAGVRWPRERASGTRPRLSTLAVHTSAGEQQVLVRAGGPSGVLFALLGAAVLVVAASCVAPLRRRPSLWAGAPLLVASLGIASWARTAGRGAAGTLLVDVATVPFVARELVLGLDTVALPLLVVASLAVALALLRGTAPTRLLAAHAAALAFAVALEPWGAAVALAALGVALAGADDPRARGQSWGAVLAAAGLLARLHFGASVAPGILSGVGLALLAGAWPAPATAFAPARAPATHEGLAVLALVVAALGLVRFALVGLPAATLDGGALGLLLLGTGTAFWSAAVPHPVPRSLVVSTAVVLVSLATRSRVGLAATVLELATLLPRLTAGPRVARLRPWAAMPGRMLAVVAALPVAPAAAALAALGLAQASWRETSQPGPHPPERRGPAAVVASILLALAPLWLGPLWHQLEGGFTPALEVLEASGSELLGLAPRGPADLSTADLPPGAPSRFAPVVFRRGSLRARRCSSA